MIDIPDQPLAQRILRAALERTNPPQQLLFYGPPGTGKRVAARAVAWGLIDPTGTHGPDKASMDLTIVAATGASIRLEADLDPALADLAARPAVGLRRVLIIDGAERLREREGAPRILKQLEEPPPRSHVILVTDHLADLLPTIRSRCLPVPFRSPGWRQIATRLEAEGVASDAAAGLARADGASALSAGAFARSMRILGVELAERALRGDTSGATMVREIQARMTAAADSIPSADLERLRQEAEAPRRQARRAGRSETRRGSGEAGASPGADRRLGTRVGRRSGPCRRRAGRRGRRRGFGSPPRPRGGPAYGRRPISRGVPGTDARRDTADPRRDGAQPHTGSCDGGPAGSRRRRPPRRVPRARADTATSLVDQGHRRREIPSVTRCWSRIMASMSAELLLVAGG